MRTEGLRDFSYQAAVTAHGGWGQVDQWKTHFERLKITNLVHGSLMIRRKADQRPAFALRRQRGAHSGPQETEWLLAWEEASADQGSAARLLDSQPCASLELELHVIHRITDGALTPSEFKLETDYPFSMECELQPWMAMLIARCDGNTTVRELFESCKSDQLIHGETPIEEFLRLLKTFIAGGFLILPGLELPATRESQEKTDARSKASAG